MKAPRRCRGQGSRSFGELGGDLDRGQVGEQGGREQVHDRQVAGSLIRGQVPEQAMPGAVHRRRDRVRRRNRVRRLHSGQANREPPTFPGSSPDPAPTSPAAETEQLRSDGGPGLHGALSASVGGSRDRQQRRRPKSRHTDGSGYADATCTAPVRAGKCRRSRNCVMLGDRKRTRNVPESGRRTR
jgi:hypothetical protein